TWDEFGAVPVDILAPERTLLEKLALLHDGASRYPYQAARTKLRNGGRHLYDVHRLLGSADVIAALSALGSVGVADLCSDIDQHSEHADFSFTPRPAVGYGGSPLVDPAWLGRDDLRQGYAAAMNLVYGERPSFNRCLDTVRTYAALL
ncbi:MAG: nucleotidyl transferase AbiEii/AbiGii toxin family protein, partial [Mycobacterium sp.]